MEATAAAENESADDMESDEFHMYCFKVLSCKRKGPHVWTACPYKHDGERAARRDPRLFNYSATPCRAVTQHGTCPFGDACTYAHSVFESGLHPTKYRTMMCRDGSECSRQVCFFAHSADEIRRPSVPTVAADAPQVLESAAAGTTSAAALTGTAAAVHTTVSTAADLLTLPGTLSRMVPSQIQQRHLDSTGAAASDGGRPNSHGLQQQRYPSGSLLESSNSSNGQLVISHSVSNLSNSQCIDANSIMTPSTSIAHPGVVPDSSSAAEYYHLMLLNGNATAVPPAPAPQVEVQWPGMVTTHAVTAEGLQLIGSCAPPGQTLPPGTVSSMPLLFVQAPQPQQQQQQQQQQQVPVLLRNQHISSIVTMVEPGVQVQQVHSIPVVPQPSGITPPSVQQGLLQAGGGGNLGDPQVLLQVSSAVPSQQQPGPSLASQVQLQHAEASNAQLLMLQPQEQLLLLGLHQQNLMQQPQQPQQQVQMQHLWQHVQGLQQHVFSLELERQQQGPPYSTAQPNTLSVPGHPAGLGAGTALVPANDPTVAGPALPATSVVFSAGCNVVMPGTQSMTCAELALPLHETAASTTNYQSISCTWL